MGVVPDEGAPGMATLTWRPYRPHVLLKRSFADPNAQFQELAADPLRAPEHIVLGHGLDKRDDLGRESLGLAPRSGLPPPDDLEQVPMPAQQRLGTDHMQCVAPAASQPGQEEQQQTVVAVQPSSLDTTPQQDILLTEQGVLGNELRARAGEDTGRGYDQPGPWPYWS